MSDEYNAKIVGFPDHIEVIKYGKTRRKPGRQIIRATEPKIRDEDEQELYDYQQAQKIRRKIKYYCQSNDFDLFWTLTFDDNKVDARDYPYAKKRLRAWLKYQREKYGKFQYIFVAELHKSGRIHFHGLTAGFSPPLTEARSPKTNRLIKKKGLQIYNAETWKNGFSTVSKIQDREKTANYISKYITKELMAIPSGYHQPRYFVSCGLNQPDIEYKTIADKELANFIPTFVAGELDMNTLEFEKTVSIYNLKENDKKELIQDSTPDTVIKSRMKTKRDKNDSNEKETDS